VFMKKKKDLKRRQVDPNQLSFDFNKQDTSIDVHIPKSSAATFNLQFTPGKKLTIKLAES